jgi:hypothetical protein
MEIRVSPKHTKDARPYALVRFKEPGCLPVFRTVQLDPEDMDRWDDTVTAFILERAPAAQCWQGALWC